MAQATKGTFKTRTSGQSSCSSPTPATGIEPLTCHRDCCDTRSFLFDNVNEWLPEVKKGVPGRRKFQRQKFLELFQEFIKSRGYALNDQHFLKVKENLDSLLPRGKKQFSRCVRLKDQMDCELELRDVENQAWKVFKGIEALGRFSKALVVFWKGQAENGYIDGDFNFEILQELIEGIPGGVGSAVDDRLDLSNTFIGDIFAEDI
ncbi:unnamed protein product [Allacma fusca]|uniref:Uncharacterized protein n=1 Tax=Allacma fusca TaxID=39272 RepID=A0A8J2PB41_9HEXA|nr:unnamed protein product [Allacma fusca]